MFKDTLDNPHCGDTTLPALEDATRRSVRSSDSHEDVDTRSGRPKATTCASSTHLVLIPSYNPGAKFEETVRSARERWNPVWVAVDGSTDGSTARLQTMAAKDPGLHVIVLPYNQGKGAAVLAALDEAAALGFTHALTMDSDGQHPAHLIDAFMSASQAAPECMVLGLPKFDASAPRLRVQGRRLSNFWADVETLWAGIGDSLYGFRVYPIAPLRSVMHRQIWMRRFDFDPEAAVRLCWAGVRPINLEAPVRYFRADEGGVSHFRYGRDNALLTWMHLRLAFGFVLRSPSLVAQRILAHLRSMWLGSKQSGEQRR
jgi:glycosyltransferase involved in cell wall biosynthesis